jgi:hypothetical protein
MDRAINLLIMGIQLAVMNLVFGVEPVQKCSSGGSLDWDVRLVSGSYQPYEVAIEVKNVGQDDVQISDLHRPWSNPNLLRFVAVGERSVSDRAIAGPRGLAPWGSGPLHESVLGVGQDEMKIVPLLSLAPFLEAPLGEERLHVFWYVRFSHCSSGGYLGVVGAKENERRSSKN